MTRVAALPQDDVPLFAYKLAIALLGLIIVGSVDLLAGFCPGDPLTTLSCVILVGLPLVITP